jgi:hypothetical protein
VSEKVKEHSETREAEKPEKALQAIISELQIRVLSLPVALPMNSIRSTVSSIL